MKKLYGRFTDYCLENDNFLAWLCVNLCLILPAMLVVVFILNLTKGWVLAAVPAYAAYTIWKWRKDDVH